MDQHGRRWVEDRISLGKRKTCQPGPSVGPVQREGPAEKTALQVEEVLGILVVDHMRG